MTLHGDDAHKYKNVIDFASNSNPKGVSEKALEVVKNNLDKISGYPDSDSTELREALAGYVGVSPENVIAGNGSAELIRLFCEVFLDKGDVVLIPVPTFSEYEENARLFGGEIINIKLNSGNNFRFNIAEIPGKINGKVKIIFLCSPNNPTGQSIPGKDVLKLAIENPETFIFLDEAFIEFSGRESLALKVEKHKNLFVLRSMTKFFALAGLRVGYGIGNKNLIKKLSDAKLEWNVNVLAQAAAIGSLRDKEYIRTSGILMEKEKKNLFNELSGIPELTVYFSDANFFLINIKRTGFSSPEMKNELLKKGILIRDCSNFRGLNKNYIRVCVRMREENEKLVSALGGIILIRKNIRNAINKKELAGSDRNCKYYPCHDLNELDCTFCFCPFYPCCDTRTGGEMVTTKNGGKVWGCKNCTWIHKPEVARKILNEILKLNVNKIEEINREKLLEIRLKCLK
jgi:threonine-phosphate decarboxylase